MVHVLAGLALLLPLTSARFRDARAHDHPVRVALLRVLAAGQWLAIMDMARAVGVSRKTVDHHLHVLERAGLVARRRISGRTVFAAAGQARVLPPEAHALGHPARRAFHEAALARPGATVPELARATGMKVSTAYFHAKVLRRHGLLALVEAVGGARVEARPLAEPSPVPLVHAAAAGEPAAQVKA